MSTLGKAGAVAFVAWVLLGGLQWVNDMLFNAWALATPPLLDEWAGSLTTGNGQRLRVVFALQRTDQSNECANCAEIEGSAVTCDAAGKVLRYMVSGSPKDRAGHSLLLGVKPRPDPPPDGLEFSAVKGTWDGADTMTLQAGFFWRRGRAAISSTDDPATQPVPLQLLRLPPHDGAGHHDPAGHCP
jgi:hypothetical protein